MENADSEPHDHSLARNSSCGNNMSLIITYKCQARGVLKIFVIIGRGKGWTRKHAARHAHYAVQSQTGSILAGYQSQYICRKIQERELFQDTICFFGTNTVIRE